MKFVLSTQELNFLINKIQNIVGIKPTMPILGNFLIEARNDSLTLTTTDLMIGIRCSTEAKIVQEGATTIPVKKFAQLIRELTAAEVEISSSPKEVTTVISGASKFKINGMHKNDFPALPDIQEAQTFTIKQSDLKDLFYRTSFAISREDTRYVLTGVCMQIANHTATLTATDGKRLARAQSQIETNAPFSSQSIIPLKAVDEILKNLTDDGEAQISILSDKIAINANNTLILTKLVAGEYPDINRIIPEETPAIITLHRDELTSILRQISLFMAENNQSVRFTFANGELKLTSNAKDIGEGDVSMPVNYFGPQLDIAFNPHFVLDILRHCKLEVVTIGLTDTFNPGLITDGECEGPLSQISPLFVIMPMRLIEE